MTTTSAPIRRPYAALLATLTTLLAVSLLPALAGPAHAAAKASTDSSTVTAPAATKIALTTDVYSHRVRRHLNRTRAAHGLPKVKPNACAKRFADSWSNQLASSGAFFHQSLGPILNRCQALWAGENLARGAVRPKRIVQLWMDSPGHRAIVLSPNAKKVGVGARVTSHGVWVVTADFVKH